MIFIDLLPYVLLLFLTVIIPKVSRKYMLLLFLVFFVFSGFRYGVGWDYFNYLEAIEGGGWMIERMEFLPQRLMLFCRNHNLTQTFYIVTGFLSVFCFFVMISKESIDPAASLFVFLCVPLFFLDSLSVVRFSLAVSIVFLACHYGYEKKYLFFVLLLLLAPLMHNGAWFAVLIIPFVLKQVKWSFATNIIVFIACFIVGIVLGSFSFINSIFDTLSNIPFFEDIVGGAEKYMVDRGNAGFSRTPYVFALINLINLFSLNRVTVINDANLDENNSEDDSEEDDRRFEHYVTMFNIGCSLMFLFSFNAVFASRVSQFFMVYLLLVVPYYRKYSIQRIVLYSIFLFVFFFQLTISARNSDFIGRLNCWLPYRMYFGL